MWRWLTVLAGVAAIVLSIPAIRHLREQPPRLPLRLTLPDMPETEPGNGDDALDVAISPGEQEIVLVARSAGVPRLWRRALADDRAVLIDATDGARFPVWTPSGDAITFFAGGQLRRLRLTDGTITDLVAAPAPAGATWLADDLLFATGDGPIRRLAAGQVTNATTLRPGERRHEFPVATGVDREFVYVAVGEDGRRIARLASDDGDRQLMQTSGHAQMVDDRLLVVRDDVLLVQPFDRARRRLSGTPAPLVIDVGVGASGRSLVAASPRLLLTSASATTPRDVMWIDTDGRLLHATNAPADYWQVRVSPDDRQVAVTQAAPLLGTLDIFRIPADGGTPVSLSTSIYADTDPVWSPDGERLAFRSLHGGRPQLVTRPVLPIGAEVVPLRAGGPPADGVPTDWKGEWLLAHRTAPATGADVVRIDVRSGEAAAVAGSSFNETAARWSPDMTWLAYVSDERGQADVYIRAWPHGEGRRVSFGGGTAPRWGHDGRALYFRRGDQIMRVARRDDGTFSSAAPVVRMPGLRDFDTAHRSPRLAVVAAAAGATSPPVRVFADWQR